MDGAHHLTGRQPIRDYPVRALVPMLVGLVVAQAARIGLDLDEAAVTPVVAAIVAYGYAVVARWLEQRVPSLRVLLGLGIVREVARYDTPTR